MIALRSSHNSGYVKSSKKSTWCHGHERFICVSEVKDNFSVELKLMKCEAMNGEVEVASSTYVDFHYDEWYTHSFAVLGDLFMCELYSKSTKLLELFANSTSYEGSSLSSFHDIAFGSQGDKYYYREVVIDPILGRSIV